MSRKRRTEITIETRQLFLVASAGNAAQAWCAECAAQAQMITPEQAAVLSGVSTRVIYSRVEAGKIHFTETPAGILVVCLDSLFTGANQS